ncbi:hypothetical protein FQ775_03885 [Nitratireductor mangrovi]|uniref:Uncharacterized protein n=1 Tax=Nitratireductor mangrovi TaxID=2599600 RepID=A0A5B8KVK9_9HYPH|nr:hypothetical protein [Nitratireductor mangrovi]QDY99582.1 hypothetical protein FQ775_03885 [Nitratireductor mangrovi]
MFPIRKVRVASDVVPARVITFASLLGFFSVTVLICGQLAAIEVVTIYSVASLLHLPRLLVMVLAVLVGIPTLWLCWKVAWLAFEAETAPENN